MSWQFLSALKSCETSHRTLDVEKLDFAALDRIFGADDREVSLVNELFEYERAVRQFFHGGADIGAYSRAGQRFFVAIPVHLEYRLDRRPHSIDNGAQVWRPVRLLEGKFFERGDYRAAVGVAKDDDESCPKLIGGELDAADLRGSDDVAGNTDDKQVAEALVKHQLDRNPRVGTGENDGEGVLSAGHAGLVGPAGQRFGIEVTGDEAAIAVAQFFKSIFG